MDVLIIGSVAYDSVSSPEGAVENALGGSATYAGLSAAFHDSLRNGGGVGLVGVVGNDFSDDDYKTLSTAGLDISGLEVADGPAFRWSVHITGIWVRLKPMKHTSMFSSISSRRFRKSPVPQKLLSVRIFIQHYKLVL